MRAKTDTLFCGNKSYESTETKQYIEAVMLDLLSIYVLNLLVTVAMFTVLVFRAWVEHKNYKLMWKELEWRRTCDTAQKILTAEKTLFTKIEGGNELYELLLELFTTNNK
ncbi:MAG: hypothetical protein NWF06_07640 [Candidatus Bathyarchaeota archaeon]|nr:hypothetical protein [Candidatus Bathyarchaeum sp.]